MHIIHDISLMLTMDSQWRYLSVSLTCQMRSVYLKVITLQQIICEAEGRI